MRKIYINVLLYALIIFSLYSAVLIGMSWDEGGTVTIAKSRLKFLFSFGLSDYVPLPFSHYFPGTYPVVAMFITQLFNKSYEIEILHIINSCVGISTIFGISKISRELFNKNVGYIVFLISFFNPVFFGHMAMNERDLVIAFCNVWTTYALIKYFKYHHIKEKKTKFLIVLGMLLGLGSSCRVAFFVTLLPIFIFLIIDSFFQRKICKKKILIKTFIKDIFIASLIAYFVLIVFWPEVYPNILVLPFSFFYETLHIPIGVPNGLINGIFYSTSNPPKDYILVLLFYKLPEYFILSYILLLIILIKNSSFFIKKFNNFYYKITLIFLIIIFPNFLLFISPYPVYDNLRLFLFLIPYLSIVPGIVIFYLMENLRFKLNKALSAVMSILFIYCVFNFFSLTPYQYTYLNFFNGKFSESYKKFEADYWVTSTKELLKKTNFKKEGQIKLALCGMSKGVAKYYLKKFNLRNVKIVSNSDYYDYIMMTNRVYMNFNNNSDTEKLKICYDQFPGKTISSVKRKGLTISLIRSNII